MFTNYRGGGEEYYSNYKNSSNKFERMFKEVHLTIIDPCLVSWCTDVPDGGEDSSFGCGEIRSGIAYSLAAHWCGLLDQDVYVEILLL